MSAQPSVPLYGNPGSGSQAGPAARLDLLATGSGFRDYVVLNRDYISTNAPYYSDAAHHLAKHLPKASGAQNPWLIGLDSKAAANRVARFLLKAQEAQLASAVLLTQSYAAYLSFWGEPGSRGPNKVAFDPNQ